MVKKAPVETIQSGTVQPGHYLVMVTGDVASVEEAVNAGRETGQDALRDLIFLPNVHPGVIEGISGNRQKMDGDALGVVETDSVAAVIGAADAGLKGAEVTLWQLRLADGLGGKGLAFFSGLVADVEAAVNIALTHVGSHLVRQVIVPQLHPEMEENIALDGRFGTHYNWPPA
jgi:microcompartment protein CcmL/EutN